VLKDLPNLTQVVLLGTQVTDDGVAHLKGCKNLEEINLDATKVTDAGLAHVKDVKKLTHVMLVQTNVTDAGLAHLKACKNLIQINVRGTRITKKGYDDLQKAHPKLDIVWDNPDRKVAEWVLSIGGWVSDDEDTRIRTVAELPQGPFKLKQVSFEGLRVG